MRISTSNDALDNTFSLSAGTISSGSLDNLKDANFSKICAFSGATNTISLGSVTGIDYIALHGLRLPSGGTVSASTGDSVTVSSNERSSNVMFYIPATFTGTLTVTISGGGTKSLAYLACGTSTEIPRGVQGGKLLPYFLNGNKSRYSTNDKGAPVRRTQEKVSPKINLSIQNAGKTWARGDYLTLLALYDLQGLLSCIDYEDDSKPLESYCLFDLDSEKVSVHGQTTELVDINLSFRVVI